MPQYVVKLEGGGEMRVNASSPQAAAANVSSSGSKPAATGSTSAKSGDYNVSNEYGDQIYNTPNGQKTGSQIMGELQQAGWDGNGDPVQVYNRTASGGGGGTPGASPAGAPGATAAAPGTGAVTPTGGTEKLTNLGAATLALQQAQQASYQAYLNARLQLDNDTLAFQKATQAFNESIKKAELSGVFEGQSTQAAIKQASDIQIAEGGLTGMFKGAPTLAAQNQYFTQGLDTQKFQQDASQQYLSLLAGLRGPQDYGQYLRVMGSTPQGLRDLVGAAAGQFVPGTGATSGAQPNAVTLPGFINQATGYQPASTGAPGSAGGTSYEEYMRAAQGLPQPNQIAPQAWNAMTDTQKKLMLGMYEQGGWNTQDVQDLYKQSLPKFGGQPTSGQIRLV